MKLFGPWVRTSFNGTHMSSRAKYELTRSVFEKPFWLVSIEALTHGGYGCTVSYNAGAFRFFKTSTLKDAKLECDTALKELGWREASQKLINLL